MLCPHCQRDFRYINAHMEKCDQRPEVRSIVAALLAGDDGNAVGLTEYNRRLAARGSVAPSGHSLRKRYGDWAAVCAAYGLEFVYKAGFPPGMKGTHRPCSIDTIAVRTYWDALVAERRRLEDEARGWR